MKKPIQSVLISQNRIREIMGYPINESFTSLLLENKKLTAFCKSVKEDLNEYCDSPNNLLLREINIPMILIIKEHIIPKLPADDSKKYSDYKQILSEKYPYYFINSKMKQQ